MRTSAICSEPVGVAARISWPVTLVDCARLSSVPLEDNRYWDIAVGMFDRLCDVGLGERVPGRVMEESLMTMDAQARAEFAFKPLLVWLANGLRKLPKPA